MNRAAVEIKSRKIQVKYWQLRERDQEKIYTVNNEKKCTSYPA